MKTNKWVGAGLIALSTIMGMASCSEKSTSAETTTEVVTATAGGLKVAYVEIDSLMSQYNFCKDYSIIMNKKGENIRATLASKERALQNKAEEFQKKYETNQFTTKAQVEQAQMALAKQQQDLQDLNERLMNDFANEQAEFNAEMRDSIQSFLKEYNKAKKFDYIISRAGDNLLVANPQYDVTSEVVAGLNKRYKQKPEVAAALGK
jgi:outer membrane protein